MKATDSCGFWSECLYMTLTEISTLPITTEVAICACESYNGYSETGLYVDTLTAINGCDSIMTLELEVKETISETIDTSICIGEEFMGYTIEGNYIDTLNSTIGCDSIIFLNLEILDGSDPACINSFYEENLNKIVIYPNPVTNRIFFRNMDEEKDVKILYILG